MDREKRKALTITDATLFSRNFSGKEGKFNPAGVRNFCVFIDDLDLAKKMKNDGWNIKWLEPKDETQVERAFLSVSVSYKNRPPRVMLVTKKGQTPLSEDEIGMLDWAEIEKVDLSINPYYWENNGGSGIKAYLNKIYVTIVEDELDEMYYDVPDSALSSISDDAI